MENSKLKDDFNTYISLVPKKKNEILNISEELSDELQIFFMKAITQMPIADIISVNIIDVLEHVKHVYNTVNTIKYCKNIPIDIIFDYVLPYRVNDEDFSLYNNKLYSKLNLLITPSSIKKSILSINSWCSLNATYASSDDRTQNAIATINAGKGRCGEESVLLVSALRSVGIPARQCYSPFWTHCDDNHAWVEVYTGKKWEFLGACEPEERLNLAWFNNAASRALITRHRVFGLNNEQINNDQNNIFTTITSTNMYIDTRIITVNVNNDGKKQAYAKVGLYTINYCSPKLIYEKTADSNGSVSFEIGKGDALLVASYNDKFNMALCPEELDEINIDIANNIKSLVFNLTPYEGDIKNNTKDDFIGNSNRLKLAQHIREFIHTNKTTHLKSKIKSEEFIKYIELARLNGDVIEKFINNTSILDERKIEILETLTKKDFCDIKYEVLCDMELAYKYKKNTSLDIFNKYLLPLRVENETLYPQRAFIKQYFKANTKIEDILSLINELALLDKYSYPALVADVKGIIENKIATSYSVPIHLVQISRALGIPARLNPVNRTPEYYDGEKFVPFYPDDKEKCSINIINNTNQVLKYGADFTICKINNGYFNYMSFDNSLSSYDNLEKGLYALTQASRQVDGSIVGRIDFIDFKKSNSISLELQKPINLTQEKLKDIDVPKSILPNSKSKYVLAYIQNNSEPTEHFLNELLENEEGLKSSKIKVVLFGESDEKNDTLLAVLDKNLAKYKVSKFNYDWKQFRRDMHIGDLRLPFITAIYKSKGLYSFANYNVGTVEMLLKILNVKSQKN